MTQLADLIQRLDGHDGSHWQTDAGPIDYSALDDAIWWLGWKCSQSTSYEDPSFAAVRAQAAARPGIEMFYPYHWLSSTTNVPNQAAWFLKSLYAQGGRLSSKENAMIDAEEKGITEDGVATWCEIVEDDTHKPVNVYTGLYVAGGSIYKSDRIRHGSKYGERTIHLAAYVPPADVFHRMQLLGVDALDLHAWQYSSDGPVPGIVGRADMNSILIRPAFEAALGTKPKPPLPPLTPITDTEDDDTMDVKKINFEGYANVFLVGSGGYTHLTEKLANEAYSALPLEEVDAHPQGMLAAASQNGMRWDDTHRDWFAADGSGPKVPPYV